jgi:hypothetical protein
MPLLAELRTDPGPGDRRRASRRTLRLEISGGEAAAAGRAVVRNVSETGLLLETSEPLQNGDTLSVELPKAGAVVARVIWCRAPYFGCEFAAPVSRGSVSAALLISPLDEGDAALATPIDTMWRLPEPLMPARRAPSPEAVVALGLLAAAATAFILALVTLQTG